MHYLLLDTQIYLDMVLHNRDASVPPQTKGYLSDVLRRPDVRLVVPDIVEQEFHRVASGVIAGFCDNLSEIETYSRCVRFPNHPSAADFQVDMDGISSHAAKWKAILRKEETLRQMVFQFEELLKDAHVIRTKADAAVTTGVVKRFLYRRCPLHVPAKQQFGDAIIVEFLVGLRRFVALSRGDQVLFVSRNFNDFADHRNKEELHPDLRAELDQIEAVTGVAFSYSRYPYATLKERFDVAVEPEVVEDERESIQALTESILRSQDGPLPYQPADYIKRIGGLLVNSSAVNIPFQVAQFLGAGADLNMRQWLEAQYPAVLHLIDTDKRALTNILGGYEASLVLDSVGSDTRDERRRDNEDKDAES